MVQPLWERLVIPQKLSIDDGPLIVQPDKCTPKKWKTRSQTDLYTHIHSIITYNGQKVKQSKYPSTDE